MRGIAGSSVVLVLLASAIACGDSYAEAPAPANPVQDGSTSSPPAPPLPRDDASSGGDASAKPSCQLDAPFGAPEPLEGIDDMASANPFLTPDELTLYFDQNNDLYVARRPSLDAPFGLRIALLPINTGPNAEISPALTDDELTIIYAYAKEGTLFPELYVRTRPKREDLFGDPLKLTLLGGTQIHPTLTPTSLYFVGNKIGDRPRAYRSDRQDGQFSVATEVLGLESEFAIKSLAVSQDELTAYVTIGDDASSNAIHVSRRASRMDPFMKPEPVMELRSKSSDGVRAISRDGCRLYITVRGGEASTVMHVAARPKL